MTTDDDNLKAEFADAQQRKRDMEDLLTECGLLRDEIDFQSSALLAMLNRGAAEAQSSPPAGALSVGLQASWRLGVAYEITGWLVVGIEGYGGLAHFGTDDGRVTKALGGGGVVTALSF